MKSWVCELCKKQISELGAFCKRTSSAYRHMSCHSEAVFEAGRLAGRQEVLDEQAEERRREREAQEARERAAQEQARAKALAAENARNDAARIANLTQAAREALKRESQGTGGERFTLIEVATPEEMAAQEAARQAEQDKVRARQAEDAKKINKCVRCGKPTSSQDHPGHCGTCWNVNPEKPVQQDLEADIKDALKRGVRPLELE